MSAIRKYADALMGRANREDITEVGKEALTSGLTGIGAGYVSGRRTGGLDVWGIPMDATFGAMGLIGSVFAPPKYFSSGVRAKVREVSGTLFGIGLFRKTEEWTGKRPKETKTGLIPGKSAAAGEHPEMQGLDPILEAARNL